MPREESEERIFDGRRHGGDLPLRDHALVGDGCTAALVSRDGSVDWFCPGRFDAPAVSCRLLDGHKGGYLRIGPDGRAGARWRYEPDTNVLETVWEATSGGLRVTDLMPFESGGDSSSCILRRIECSHGQVHVEVELVPTPDYARSPVRLASADGGWTASGGGQAMRLAVGPGGLDAGTGVVATAGGHREAIRAGFTMRAGEVRWVALTAGRDQAPPPPTPAQAEEALRFTRNEWRAWCARGRYVGQYANALRRSALLLRLLIHSPTGAFVAAPTTSLPEDPGGVRNWDYRFCWLRDAAWIADALMGLGYHDEAMAYIGWLEARGLADAVPAILYAVDGTRPEEELELPHLAGWRGSRPVRIGNGAAAQRQNDVFGEVVDAIYICSEQMASMRPLRPGLWAVVERLADAAAERWAAPDRGMWEVRGASRPFFASRLLCWVALDRALQMARRDGLGARSCPRPMGVSPLPSAARQFAQTPRTLSSLRMPSVP